jgi:hypothetical protein
MAFDMVIIETLLMTREGVALVGMGMDRSPSGLTSRRK